MSESLPSRLSEDELHDILRIAVSLPGNEYKLIQRAYKEILEMRDKESEALQASENAIKRTVQLSDRVTELEEILKWYADESNYEVPMRKYYEGVAQYGKSEIDKDEGTLARLALKGVAPIEPHNPL